MTDVAVEAELEVALECELLVDAPALLAPQAPTIKQTDTSSTDSIGGRSRFIWKTSSNVQPS